MTTSKTLRRARTTALSALASAVALCCFTTGLQAQTLKSYYAEKKAPMIKIDGDLSFDTNGAATPFVGSSSPYLFGFEGISQYDGAAFGRNFIPPDTMGAVGRSQFVETTNGAYAVFDKATGTRTALMSDVTFWANAGQTGTQGDTRILYNAAASRWVAIAFGNNTADLQIAVSNTDNALGTWQSTKFTGFAGGTADYPTLAMDTNAVYIGSNNFKVGCDPSAPTANRLCGTTLNVIPLNSLLNAGAPTVTNMKQFVTPLNYAALNPATQDRGFAQQGVNSFSASSTGRVVANSMFFDDNVTMTVTGLTASSAAGSSLSTQTYMNIPDLSNAGAGRQPSASLAANQRVLAINDQRISSSVYEYGGKLYMVQTVGSAGDEARVRYTVVDAATSAVLSSGDIGYAGYDFYEGAIAVNGQGQVVISYNRSGLQQADGDGDGLSDGNVTFMARTFFAVADGHLASTGNELKLKVSLTDDYHNGSLFGAAAAGRQRWGDYSQVTVDPSDPNNFWVIGEFAREYNNPAGGHPTGTGGSRWGTWIAQIAAPVPEPGTWGMMMLGVGALVALARRRKEA